MRQQKRRIVGVLSNRDRRRLLVATASFIGAALVSNFALAGDASSGSHFNTTAPNKFDVTAPNSNSPSGITQVQGGHTIQDVNMNRSKGPSMSDGPGYPGNQNNHTTQYGKLKPPTFQSGHSTGSKSGSGPQQAHFENKTVGPATPPPPPPRK
jgi:hypothetical protein